MNPNKYEKSFIKLIVGEGVTPINVSNLTDSLYDKGCHDVKIIETLNIDVEEDVEVESEDTLTTLTNYVNATYGEHYSKNQFQATEFIIDGGHGEGFTLGNVMKYAQRYGKKDGYNRKDLMKILHYALIALHVHDLEHGDD